MVHNLAVLFWIAQNPLTNYWRKLTNRTFVGLYHANAFDIAVMIPYFLVLIVLASYGLHRYWLVYSYFKYRQNVTGTPLEPAKLTKDTIHITIYKVSTVCELLDVHGYHSHLSQ